MFTTILLDQKSAKLNFISPTIRENIFWEYEFLKLVKRIKEVINHSNKYSKILRKNSDLFAGICLVLKYSNATVKREYCMYVQKTPQSVWTPYKVKLDNG